MGDEVEQGRAVDQAWLGEAVMEMRANGRPGDTMREFNDALVAEYRSSGGTSMGTFPIHKIGILTMKGAKTGQERVVPVGFEEIDGRILVIATQGGMPTHPNWYHNLVADPNVTVEFKGETWPARAVELDADDRADVFSKLEGNFKTYETMIAGARHIPVFDLQRQD